ncbi:MAG TPA: hypothetical protein VFF73_37600 [Planctomycetota bacterium]|nr:hypothetical protein [Planctomycetota bacterium]
MSERDLELNSLNRYSKKSPEFVLEEYGSCEVPAGCGGVVLRWVRRDEQEVQVSVSVFDRGDHEICIDGQPRQASTMRLRVGRHALGLKLSGADPTTGILMLRLGPYGRPTCALTAPDGRWKATLAEPPTAWSSLGFDDSTWIPLVAREIPHGPAVPEGDAIHAGNRLDYAYHHIAEHGAQPLGLPDSELRTLPAGPRTIWVRHEFGVATV